jgi:hypothetical protein
MADPGSRPHPLQVLVGKWSMEPRFDAMPAAATDARVVFEWLPGERFLVQRWSVPAPEAPDGIAVIGSDTSNQDQYLQHYFDSRGVARVYRMKISDTTWTSWRDEADFSSLDFRPRYAGDISIDGRTITGHWEIGRDGTTCRHDFDLLYRKLSS